MAAYSGNKTLSLVSALCETSGLYYKPVTIVNYDIRVINKLETSLTDDARVATHLRLSHVYSTGHKSMLWLNFLT